LMYIDCYVPSTWVTWPSTPPSDCPFPISKDILGYDYMLGANANYGGADTWYPSWGADDKLYSSWTDGSVNGYSSNSGANGGASATTGMAVITGDNPFNLTVEVPCPPLMSPALPYQGRYPSASLHVTDPNSGNSTWFYATYTLTNYQYNPNLPVDCGNWCILGPFTWWRWSEDGGKTWTDPGQKMTSDTDNLFGETSYNNSKVKMGAPHVIDLGRNLESSPDGNAYLIATGASLPNEYESWMQGSQVYIAKFLPTPSLINNRSNYKFWDGTTWNTNLAEAKPLFTWGNRTGVVTMTYIPLIKKYIMVVSTPTNSPYTVKEFDTYFLEADEMVGPWAMISYLKAFGPEAYFVHLPSKFLGQIVRDGEDVYFTFYLSYSANFAGGFSPLPPGSGYHWSLQLSRFKLSQQKYYHLY